MSIYLGLILSEPLKKIGKNIGLLYCVSQFLNEDPLKTVYFLYILVYSYLGYANIAWVSTYATKL